MTEDAAKIANEVVVVHEVTARVDVAPQLIRLCGVTRDPDLAPDLVHTTSMYVCLT